MPLIIAHGARMGFVLAWQLRFITLWHNILSHSLPVHPRMLRTSAPPGYYVFMSPRCLRQLAFTFSFQFLNGLDDFFFPEVETLNGIC